MNISSRNRVISTNEVLKILLDVGTKLQTTMENILLVNYLLFFIKPYKNLILKRQKLSCQPNI